MSSALCQAYFLSLNVCIHRDWEQNNWYFADDIFKLTFRNENINIFIEILLKFIMGVQLTIIQHSFK